MRSLRLRLIVWISAALAVVTIASGVLLFFFLRSALISQFDASLVHFSMTLSSLIETDGTQVQSDMSEEEFVQFSRSIRPDFYCIVDARGAILEESSCRADMALHPVQDQEPAFQFTQFADSRPARAVALRISPKYEPEGFDDDDESNRSRYPDPIPNQIDWNQGSDDLEQSSAIGVTHRIESNRVGSVQLPITLIVARDTLELNRSLQRVSLWLMLATGLTLLLGIVAASVVSKIGLLPLERTAAYIHQVDFQNLEHRIEFPPAPAEIQSIIDSLNQMLDRLEVGYDRERNFSANVAHELRTPLAGLKSTAEVVLSRPRESAEYREALQQCLTISNETESIIENLLMLARIDSGRCELVLESCNVSQMIDMARDSLALTASARGLNFSTGLEQQIVILTDGSKLKWVLQNILENAVAHSDANSTISIRAHISDGQARIEVSNRCANFCNSSIEKMFERFWRADIGRSQTGKHSGIGLPLCQSLMRLLSGEIDVRVDHENVVTVGITIPSEIETN